jgi:hypothetical protein
MILVTSTPPPEIIPGQVYRYQVVATHREGLPLTYTFENSNGYGGAMQVDSNTGLFTWDTPASLAPGSYFIFIYAGDGSGESGYAPISATVCEPPLHWNTEEEACQ